MDRRDGDAVGDLNDMDWLISALRGKGNDGTRYARIIWRRFCLPEWQTLASVAAEEGVSRERVRQIERKALRRLAHRSRQEVVSQHVKENSRLYWAIWSVANEDRIKRAKTLIRIVGRERP